ncbi:MAG TPA: hypothetical protein VM889_02930 [Candidatus Thermoplasmatota archaeon]|nr:hypothetical protein [Candidatus Thermoplasmatota archaeon]
MKAHALVALMIALAGLATVPTAAAHDCGGVDCGPCVEGENHNHGGPSGGCSTRRALPGFEVALVGLALLGIALVARRARSR